VSPSPSLPKLDCHAHIAPDVTDPQVAALKGALIFAMTRSPAEAAVAARRRDETILWGYGAHPGLKTAIAQITEDRVRRAITDHLIIGEIGLDRGSVLHPQQVAFDTILKVCADQPALLSIHSTGRTCEVINALARYPHPGAILHWFNGTRQEINEAAELGCYFSVNAAMSDERINWMPRKRLLPETDFPSSRRSTRAKLPADIDHLEERMARLTGQTPEQVRLMWHQNLRRLIGAAGVESRLPDTIKKILRAAESVQ
jgi:TatD DNase family protein